MVSPRAPRRALPAAAAAATLLAAVAAGPAAAAAAPAPAPAPAARPTLRVAVFPFEGFDLPPALEMTPVSAAEAVSRTLAGAGHDVIEPPLTLRDMVVALDCKAVDGPCAVKMGKNLSVDRVVVGKLYAADGGVLVRVRIFACADGRIVYERDETARADARSLSVATNHTADAVAAATATAAAPAAAPGPHRSSAPLGLLAAGGALAACGLASAIGLGATVASIDHAPDPATVADFDAVQRRIESGHRLAVASAVLGGVGIAVMGAGLILLVGERPSRGGGGVALLGGVAPGGGPALALRWRGALP